MRVAAALRPVALLCVVAGCAACSGSDGEAADRGQQTAPRDAPPASPEPPLAPGKPPPARFASIDERRGAYGPVAIGDTLAQARRALGPKRPATRDERLTPTGSRAAFHGPTTMNFPHRPTVPASGLLVLRYRDVALYFLDRRLAAFVLTSPGARTRKGVGIGTALARAKRLYPELRCGLTGGGQPTVSFPACTGRIRGGVYVWLGADPIENITISIRPPTGV